MKGHIRKTMAPLVLQRVSSSSQLVMQARCFGNAPGRIRPLEEPKQKLWTTTAREVSALLVISSMFVVPMWGLLMWREANAGRKAQQMEWVQGYLSNPDPYNRRPKSDED